MALQVRPLTLAAKEHCRCHREAHPFLQIWGWSSDELSDWSPSGPKMSCCWGNSSWFAITTTKHSCHCHEGCFKCVFKCVHFCGCRTGIEPCSMQGLPPTEAGNMEISWHVHNILDDSTSQHPYFLLGYTFQWAPQSHQIKAKTRRILSIILPSPPVRVSMYEVSGHNGFLGLLPKNRTQQCYCQHSAKRWRHATWSANENMALYSAYWTFCVWRHMAMGQNPGTLSTLK